MPQVKIVVPCHNEAQRLNVAEFRRFARQHDHIRFVLVNDGSTDATLTVLGRLAAADGEHFEVLDLPENCGKAEAVRRGVLQAATAGPAAIGYWDADLATPLGPIAEFAEVLAQQPEILTVLGVRLPLLGHDIRRHVVRRWLSAEFSQVVSFVFGQRFHDTQCGAKLFRATPETLAAFSQPFSSRWIFDVELLARLKRLLQAPSPYEFSQSLYEFPLRQWQDVAGSKLKRGDFFKAVGELAAIWWRYLRPGAPQFFPAATAADGRQREQQESRRAA